MKFAAEESDEQRATRAYGAAREEMINLDVVRVEHGERWRGEGDSLEKKKKTNSIAAWIRQRVNQHEGWGD